MENKVFPTELVAQEFAHLEGTYLNAAYFGPSPSRAKKYLEIAISKELNPSFYPIQDWMFRHEVTRDQLGRLLGVSPDLIAHHNSATDIINLVARGGPFKPDDLVVCFEGDYPSNVLPWMGAQEDGLLRLKRLQCSLPTVDWLKKNLPKETKALSVSHVQFDTGKKIDLKSIGAFLKERGVMFIADGTQSFGGMGLSQEEIQSVDVFACATYKWLLGPYGHAFGYFSPDIIDSIRPNQSNWISSKIAENVKNLVNYTTEPRAGARKFDRGQTPSMLSQYALSGGLEVLEEIGLDKIATHNQKLVDYFLENFPQEKFQLRTPKEALSNIVSLRPIGVDVEEVEKLLVEQKVDVSIRQSNLRLSFHLYNTEKDVDKVLSLLNEA